MPITLTVAEKRAVIERRCKQAFETQMENQITLDSMRHLIAQKGREFTPAEQKAIDDLEEILNLVAGQIAYFQAQWEALEDVVLEQVADEVIASNGKKGKVHA